MAGIVSYGLHFACYRLPLEKIAQAWESRAGKGEKAVANADEDALTLAAAAAQDLIGEQDPASFGGLYFASTSSPYLEKSVAAFIAHAHRLPKGALTADFTSTRRCATNAVKAALDAVKAGSAKKVIVTSADVRTPEPGASLEQVIGDGGAALCIGDEGVVAEVLGSHSVSREGYDEFRRAGDDYVNEGDARFSMSHEFAPSVIEAIRGALEKAKVKPEDIAWVSIPTDTPKALKSVLSRCGLSQDRLLPAYLPEVGYLGSAQPLVGLALALEKAKPGEKILWVGYGDGADAFVLETTAALENLGGSKVEAALADKKPLGSYEKYLKFRGIFRNDVPGPEETPVLNWNEHQWALPLQGHKCGACGTIYFPPQGVCMSCGSRKDQELVPLPRRGKIFTYTVDHLVANGDSPQVTTVVTVENGARLFLQGTDFIIADEAKIDQDVEFQIRRLHDGGEFPVYFWKSRPVR